MIQRIINRICKSLDISLFYESDAGIKCINGAWRYSMLPYVSRGEVQLLPAESLYMCADRLKDSYTLLNTKIMSSPHFELMQILRDGGDLSRSTYIQRLAKGTLDPRTPVRVGDQYFQVLRNKYAQMSKLIESGKYEPVQLIVVSGQYFIADGRHTAALCALKNIAPKCVDVSPLIYDSFNWCCYHKMLKNKDRYKKHVSFFESIMPTLDRNASVN